MTEQISSLMDGELEPQEAERAIRRCCADEDQKQAWFIYHAIGDAMRGHAPRNLVRPSVLEALRAQPTVLAPKPRVAATALKVAFAAAASVATVAVVAWIGLQGGAPDRGAETAAAKSVSPIQPVANKTTIATPTVSVDEQAYLTAHRQLPAPELYRPVNNRAATPAR